MNSQSLEPCRTIDNLIIQKKKKRKFNPNVMVTLYPDTPNEYYAKVQEVLIEEQIIMKVP